jgi:hypothetical protein
LLLVFCCVISLTGQDYAQTEETADSNATAAEPVYPGGQGVFEGEPLNGKQADAKAMEERVKDINYAELPPDAPKNPRFNKPRLDTPGDIGRYKDIIFWSAVFILVGLLVFLIFKSGKRKHYARRTSLAGPAEWEEAWNLDATTLETDLQDAVEAGQYKRAIRLLYLKNLKQLIDNELVKPSPEKTNRQYGQELGKAGLQELFGKNTTVYETVWYGEATPDSQQYRKLAPLFHELYERSRR